MLTDGGSDRQANEGQRLRFSPSSAGTTGSDPFLIELETGVFESGA